jgi:HD-like signal output (HDOD) protein
MKAELINVIDNIQQLPVLPATTVKLISLLSDQSTSIDEVLKVVQYDQNLTIQVLKICNSAYFGLTRKINSLREAVVYLGAKNLMHVVMGLHCNAMLQQPQKGYGLLPGMLWRHSTAVAIAADKLVDKNDKTPPSAGLLFTAGLLHDIGKVILDQVLANNYLEILEKLETTEKQFNELEREVLGYSHDDVGEMVLLHWQLPDMLASVCRYHHDPNKYDGHNEQVRHLVDLVHMADSLVISLGLGVGIDGLRYEFDASIAERNKLTREKIDQAGAEVLLEMKSLEQIYQE